MENIKTTLFMRKIYYNNTSYNDKLFATNVLNAKLKIQMFIRKSS